MAVLYWLLLLSQKLRHATTAQLTQQIVMLACAGLFYHLMQMTAYIYNIEFVVVDMSPNCGAFNQNILTSSNAFFMPATIDPKVR